MQINYFLLVKKLKNTESAQLCECVDFLIYFYFFQKMSFFRNTVWFVKGLREYTHSGYVTASKWAKKSDNDRKISNALTP